MNQQIPPDKMRVEVKRKIDRICDRLETAWRNGGLPELHPLVNEIESFAMPGFLSEIIKVDKEVNRRNESELRDIYVREFPDYSKVVLSILFDIFEVPSVESNEFDDLNTRTQNVLQNDFGSTFIGKTIGEYLVEEKIGEGGFGVVFLARDSFLPRQVVIKIPKAKRFKDTVDLDQFLDEARNAALLDHPHILKILHVGLDSGLPYIVQEYFECGDLRNALKQNSFSLEATTDLISKLASAIGYAHQNRIVHRDLKPANILLNRNGDPVIADFGLSIHEAKTIGRVGELGGTVRYMSPEQVRGEFHRLDGRTDIWSIGIILYLMMVGHYPFEGKDAKEICEAILYGRPLPPRQLKEQVTEELERICLKCLSRRVNDRYDSAFDLAEDLNRVVTDQNPVQVDRDFNQNIPSACPVSEKLPVVPKGLVAFDRNDRDFFLDLLPGPYGRNGIPVCIQFWKNQIENTSRTNPVGLIYGPSGCGKSSLVSAGVLPRLSKDFLVVFIEATPRDTEVRLLKGLRAEIPSLPGDLSLPELIAGIRQGRWLPKDRRLLLVFDQFEQWLHANPIDEHVQLVHALRQCDGRSVQSLILVRDDFWMGVSRFFRQLEIELVERKNFASVDLFSKRHAKAVLTHFGRAFGNLPESDQLISKGQHQFLDRAIDLVAENDQVICVRLVLFAETVKNRPWEIATLHQIGDAKNIGILFLDQVLGDGNSNPTYRYFREPILAVLEPLLPDLGVDIKGNLRSVNELATLAKLEADGTDFKQVLKILDSELRLISPTEPDSGRRGERVEKNDHQFFQLTHDYLVPSLRDWLHSIRGQTRQGRAKLRLQELTSAWGATRHRRFMPGFFEYCSIVFNVHRKQLSPLETKFIRRADRFFGIRAASLFLVLFMIAGIWWKVQSDRRLDATSDRVAQFMSGEAGSVYGIAELLRQDPDNAIALLNGELKKRRSQTDLLRAHVGMAMLGQLDADRIRVLIDSVAYCSGNECSNLVAALASNRPGALLAIENKIGTADNRGWVRLEILRMFLDTKRIIPSGFEFAFDPTRRSLLVHSFRDWHGDLNETPAILDSATDEATIAGLCICLGRIEPERFGEAVFDDLQLQMRELYWNHDKASVHGASRWALTHWGLDLPILEPSNPTTESEWWVNENQMTMVRVAPGIVPNENRDKEAPDMVDREFHVSTCEITIEQFEVFLNDSEYPAEQKPKDWTVGRNSDIPKQTAATPMSQLDAILFCNWLSTKNGLDACFKRTGKQLTIEDLAGEDPPTIVDQWKLIDGANGYRFPSNAEWDSAARSGCTTNYYFCDDLQFPGLKDYIWCDTNSMEIELKGAHRVGQKIPNRAGLFDVLGNVNEFCWGQKNAFETPNSDFYSARRGGDCVTRPSLCIFVYSWPLSVVDRGKMSGLRVVMNAHPPR